jgi:glycosyltransferase involved in cell wall biosynthesis
MLNILRWAGSTEKLFRKYQHAFGKPDIILAHSSIWGGYAASKIAARHDIPYILTEHRSRFTGMTSQAERLIRDSYFPLLREAFSGAARVITVSDALHPSIRNFTPEKREILTIPNLVDTDFFVPPDRRSRDPFVILSIGRLEHEKGMDLLIRAFGRLVHKLPGASLRIVGKGPLESQLRKLASQVQGAENIQFLGQLTPAQLQQELQLAKVLAVASRFEAFGVVFIEAMSTGLPVLAARSGGPETFICEMAGWVAENDSDGSVYEGLKHIYDHYKDYDSVRIREYVGKTFSREAVMKKYAELIREISGQKGPEP